MMEQPIQSLRGASQMQQCVMELGVGHPVKRGAPPGRTCSIVSENDHLAFQYPLPAWLFRPIAAMAKALSGGN